MSRRDGRCSALIRPIIKRKSFGWWRDVKGPHRKLRLLGGAFASRPTEPPRSQRSPRSSSEEETGNKRNKRREEQVRDFTAPLLPSSNTAALLLLLSLSHMACAQTCYLSLSLSLSPSATSRQHSKALDPRAASGVSAPHPSVFVTVIFSWSCDSFVCVAAAFP